LIIVASLLFYHKILSFADKMENKHQGEDQACINCKKDSMVPRSQQTLNQNTGKAEESFSKPAEEMGKTIG
jgi:hypothetical protein